MIEIDDKFEWINFDARCLSKAWTSLSDQRAAIFFSLFGLNLKNNLIYLTNILVLF